MGFKVNYRRPQGATLQVVSQFELPLPVALGLAPDGSSKFQNNFRCRGGIIFCRKRTCNALQEKRHS